MENKPGNGKDSPFGNGNGGVTGVPASSGGHNFLEDPTGNSPKTGGRDFSKEMPDQKSGAQPTINPQSVPAGGPLPFSGEPAPVESGSPFRITGG